MPLSDLAQPGILEAIPLHARYLVCQRRLGEPPQAVLRRLASQADGQSMVVALGASLVQELGAEVPGLRTFSGMSGSRVKLPATPADLLIWLRGTDRGDLLTRSRHLQTLLAPAFDMQSITDAFSHGQGKDLTGHHLGTANPQQQAAAEAALVPDGTDGLKGGSFLALQHWRHHMSRFEAMSRSHQDHCVGRSRETHEPLEEAAASAHVKRTCQADFIPPAHVLRRSMPWAEGNQSGLVFAAFGRSFDAFESLLRRMSGAEDGITDALFSFTEPESGAYFWCPPMQDGLIDLRALGL
jgi:putative iron-dependent peroxidase